MNFFLGFAPFGIEIYSMNGSFIDCHNLVGLSFSFHLSSSPADMYIVRVRSGESYFSNKIF
jgi:hypothetical protein